MPDRRALRRGRIGITFAMVLLGGVAAVSYERLAQLGVDAAWSDRTHHIIETIDQARVALLAADSARRSYRLAFDPADKDALEARISETEHHLDDLEDLLTDDPSRRAVVDALRPLVRERTEILRAGLDLPRIELQEAPARDEVRAQQARGAALTKDVRKRFDGLLREERRTLAERQERARLTTASARVAIVVGGVVGLALVALFYVSLERENRRRKLAEMRLREQAIRDPLTGLYNRGYLDETLVREIERARRRGVPLSVVMIDLDHFKRLNDARGHAAGDLVLKRLGDLLRSRVRREDVPCRYGGEELAIVLPDMPAEVARTRAEEIRACVAATVISMGPWPLPPITASFGVACFPDHGTDADQLLASADAALYEAKAGGRDRVQVAHRAPTKPRSVRPVIAVHRPALLDPESAH